MKPFYFTFGQAHVHHVNGRTFDKDDVVLINAESEDRARKIMSDYFGLKWSMCYTTIPPMSMFPKGITNLTPQ